jgi:hypothetical protein
MSLRSVLDWLTDIVKHVARPGRRFEVFAHEQAFGTRESGYILGVRWQGREVREVIPDQTLQSGEVNAHEAAARVVERCARRVGLLDPVFRIKRDERRLVK